MNIHSPKHSTPELVKLDYLRTLPRAKRAWRLFVFGAMRDVIHNDEVDGMLEIFADLAPKDQVSIIQMNDICAFATQERPDRAARLMDCVRAMPQALRAEALAEFAYFLPYAGFANELVELIETLDHTQQQRVLKSDERGGPVRSFILLGAEAQLRALIEPWTDWEQAQLNRAIWSARSELHRRTPTPEEEAIIYANRLRAPRPATPPHGKPAPLTP